MMLNIETNAAARSFFVDNHQKITIIRPFGSTTNPLVVCMVFSPFGENNTLEFLDDWIEYASLQSIQNGEIIALNLTQEVNLGNTYVLNNSSFGSSYAAPESTVYGLDNQNTGFPSMTCGLGQKLNVNHIGALYTANYVISVPTNQTIYFEPDTEIWVLASAGLETNMILPKGYLTSSTNAYARSSIIVGKYLQINLDGDKTIHFDTTTNTFLLGSYPN